MSPALDHEDQPLDELYPERAGLRGLAKTKWDLTNIFVGAAMRQAEELVALLQLEAADVIVSDPGLTGAPVASETMDVPHVTVGISPLPLRDPTLAPFGPGLQPARSILGRARNAVMYRVFDQLMFRDAERHINGVRGSFGLPPLKADLLSATVSADLHLQVGVAGLEHPRQHLPEQVKFVGSPVGKASNITRPSWWPEIVESSRPIVHVTQGTVANNDLEELVLPTIRALAGEDVWVVAVTGRSGGNFDPAALPANARIASLLPYDELLPRTSVLVTNGGYGTVNQALSHGAPVVTAGTTEDKAEVGARIARAGVGIDLRTSRPSEERLRTAVLSAVGESDVRVSARRLSQDYEAIDTAAMSADLIENLAKQR
ncbi:glycosyltransferase [Kribbella sp. NPDC055071]